MPTAITDELVLSLFSLSFTRFPLRSPQDGMAWRLTDHSSYNFDHVDAAFQRACASALLSSYPRLATHWHTLCSYAISALIISTSSSIGVVYLSGLILKSEISHSNALLRGRWPAVTNRNKKRGVIILPRLRNINFGPCRNILLYLSGNQSFIQGNIIRRDKSSEMD
ncbi:MULTISPECIES: hypothetical protein [Lonsdalea]|uniref:hypothetical protein n=1 Tax=Lonsdalea TaxID=1082702 RepID=UPI0011BF14FF|nr:MULTISPECIES: hypothetical protein [Lonsdalea]